MSETHYWIVHKWIRNDGSPPHERRRYTYVGTDKNEMKERFVDTCWKQHNHTGELRTEVEEDPENELTQMIEQAKENFLFFDWEWEKKGNYDAVYLIESETRESFCDVEEQI